MLLDLSRLRGGTEQVARTFPPEAFEPAGEDFRVVSPVELAGELRKDGTKVRLVGRLATTLECGCSRCLDAFHVPVDARFDLMFLPVSENTGGGEHGIEEDDLGVSYYRDDTIDLGEVMREQFYLALPMKPLCREDCRGLCPVCGVNRNREACSCTNEWQDPRLEALRRFKTE